MSDKCPIYGGTCEDQRTLRAKNHELASERDRLKSTIAQMQKEYAATMREVMLDHVAALAAAKVAP